MRSFGFKKKIEKQKTHKYMFENGKEEYYNETLWEYDDGITTIDDDFSEFEWELEKSNIFIREE